MAGTRFSPISSAIRIVEPERDAPGNIAAINWPKPMAMAIAHVTCVNAWRSTSRFSTKTKRMPPINNATATGSTSSGSSKPSVSINTPPQPVIKNATSNLAM